jgi:hypothetical protein
MRCWILIQIWTFFALQTPQNALRLSFVGCHRVSTHAARDNQPQWIAAGSAAGYSLAIHGLPLKVWLGHGRRLQPAATMPPYYVPEKFAKLFAFHGRSVQPYRDPNRSVTQKFGIPVGGRRPADDHHRGHATATGWPA